MLSLLMLLPTLVASNLHFSFASSLIPHPSKTSTGGEDSYYADGQLLIVADGVGGWKRRGIDSGKFSRTLCENGKNYFCENSQYYSRHPNELIKRSHENNHNDGSSTIVVLTLDQARRVLKSSYIGDSRYLIIRNHKLLFEAKEQLHSFNFPYQLTKPHSKCKTTWKHSINHSHDIKNLDIIVVGSDGLFDNIFVNDILGIIKSIGEFDGRYLENKEEVANYLSNLAILNGKNTRCVSPFSVNAKKYKKLWRGGKLDDTTTIIAQVVEESEEESRDGSSSSSSSSDSSSESKHQTHSHQQMDDSSDQNAF